MTIEELQIEIQASAASASNGIDAVSDSLSRLRSAAKGGIGLTAVSKQIESLNKAVAQMSNPSQKIKDLVMALTPLETIGKSKLGTALNQLKKIPEITEQLDNAKLSEFADKIKRVTEAVAPLATEMEKVSQGFSKLPMNLQRAIDANAKMTHSNTRLGRSFSNINLAAFLTNLRHLTSALRSTARTIANWIEESNNYVENLNLFTISMGKYTDEAKRYAEEVGDALGIDPSQFMRYQAIFQNMTMGFGVVEDKAAIMSKNLTQLGYDLASVFNVNFETAMEKLESAIAGQPRPMREWGFDLSEATIKAVALEKGIQKNVETMGQMEKAQLRYVQLIETAQRLNLTGNFSRELITPANQLRVFQAQIIQASRALGNVFIPALSAVLPYATAFLQIIRWIAQELALLAGFTLPEIDYSGLNSGAGAIEDTTDALKDLKAAMIGIDELNVLGDTGSALDGLGKDLGITLPEYDFISDLVESEASKIFEKWKKDLQPVADLLSSMTLTFKDVFFKWDDLTVGDIIDKLVVGLNSLTWMLVGWQAGGPGGAVIGAVIGTGLGLAMASLLPDFDNLKKEDIPGLIAAGLMSLIGLGVGIWIGGFTGGLLGMTIALGITLVAQKIDWDSMSTAGKIGTAAAGLAVLGGAIYAVHQKTKGLTGAFGDKNKKLSRQNDLEQTAAGKATSLAAKLAAAAGAAAIAAHQFGAFNGVLSGIPSYSGQAQGAFANVGQSLSALQNGASQTNSAFSAMANGIEGSANQINNSAQTAAENSMAVKNSMVNSFSLTLSAFWALNQGMAQLMNGMSQNGGITGFNIQSAFLSAFSQIGSGFSAWGNSFLQSFARFGNSLGNMAAQAANSMGKTLTQGFSNIWNSFTSLMGSMGEKVSGWWSQNWKTVAIGGTIIAAAIAAPYIAPAVAAQIAAISVGVGGGALALSRFASGGFPVTGQMFIARESGPELVGTIGGRTAVANNEQIEQSIAAAVYDAVVSAMAQGGNGDGQAVKVYLDGRQVNASVRKTQRDQGAGIMTGGILYGG